MTLRIQCPSCQRQFKVSEDLKGRTVECGACENQFSVDEGVIVKKKDKFYPGEGHRTGLERYGRTAGEGNPEVRFQTARYNQAASAADVSPLSPQETVAGALGVLVQIGFAGFLVFGIQTGLFFRDMELGKRIVLAAFVVVVGAALIVYASMHRKKGGLMTASALGALVMVLAIFLPVPTTIPDLSAKPAAVGDPEPVEPGGSEPMTSAELIEAIGYAPVQAAIDRCTDRGEGPEGVVAIWALGMEERFKYQIQKFLHRKAGTKERPSFLRRSNGGLFVIEGTKLGLSEIEALVDRFGRVEEVYPDIRVLVVTVGGDRLLEASAELMGKLKDKSHPAFYFRNKSELDHINIDRVENAARRLAEVEPKRFQPEISRRLVELIDEEASLKFKDTICQALAVWSKPGDGAEKAVSRVARQLLLDQEPLPRSMVEFLVDRQAPEAIPIAEMLWAKEPATWEPILASVGSGAEAVIAPHLDDEERSVRISAVRILRRIGTEKSLPALREALAKQEGDEDLRTILLSAIEAIENPAPGGIPEPDAPSEPGGTPKPDGTPGPGE